MQYMDCLAVETACPCISPVSAHLLCRQVPVTGFSHLYGKLELLALEDFVVVDIEEVAVEDGLNDTGDDGDPLCLVVGFGGVSVDPVGDVEETVDAQGKQVVGRDGFGLAGSLQHEELRENGDGLQPDGKRPEDLTDSILLREKDGENGGSTEEVVDLECIDVGIGGGLVSVGHEVDDVALGANEHDLEEKVVEARGYEDICDVSAGKLEGG